MVERLFLAVPRGCLQFVIVVFPDHAHLLFSRYGQNVWKINVKEIEYIWVKENLNVP